MKCPNCGHWNRASFPRCFVCGTPLNQEIDSKKPSWKEEVDNNFKPRSIAKITDEENIVIDKDPRDVLATEMKDLRKRKKKGEEEQRRMQLEEDSPLVSVATGRRIQSTSRRRELFDKDTLQNQDENQTHYIRPDSIPVLNPRTVDYDDYEDTEPFAPIEGRANPRKSPLAGHMTTRQMRHTRPFGFHRFARIFIPVLLVLALLSGSYYFVIHPLFLSKNGEVQTLQSKTIISPSIFDEMPAHIIKIPGPENTQIYIKELRKSYTVISGYATIEVPDYTWYQHDADIDQPIYSVTLTPYMKTASGNQKPMETITFDVDIPLSPLTLVSPDVTFVTVNDRAKYQIQFQVEKGSSVTINGEDFSDLVSTQDGLISYNVTVQPTGNNEVVIETKAKYYRRNTLTLTLYRQPQSIQLELDPTLGTSWASSAPMKVSGTTLNKATINVLSPHRNLDLTKLITNGTFSFEAIFPIIGTNTIEIKASYPGKEDTFVRYEIYHVPPASEYTRKAWPMKAYNYSELLDNLDLRISSTQIYVCKGTITEILTTSPQLAILETGTAEDSRPILLENKSTDVWKVGEKYNIYGDAFGSYNGMPRLIGRYTYSYRD